MKIDQVLLLVLYVTLISCKILTGLLHAYTIGNFVVVSTCIHMTAIFINLRMHNSTFNIGYNQRLSISIDKLEHRHLIKMC